MQTPELQSKLVMWRAKAADGSITLEEMKEAIIAMRESRLAAVTASAASRAKTRSTSKPSRNVDDMLSELEGL